jgi:hypothetical protein
MDTRLKGDADSVSIERDVEGGHPSSSSSHLVNGFTRRLLGWGVETRGKCYSLGCVRPSLMNVLNFAVLLGRLNRHLPRTDRAAQGHQTVLDILPLVLLEL